MDLARELGFPYYKAMLREMPARDVTRWMAYAQFRDEEDEKRAKGKRPGPRPVVEDPDLVPESELDSSPVVDYSGEVFHGADGSTARRTAKEHFVPEVGEGGALLPPAHHFGG